MLWGLQWQSSLRGSRLVPALTHCTCWPRRWRCSSLHIHIEAGQDLLMLIGISTGDTLPLQDGLQCWKRRICSCQTLNCQTEAPKPDVIEGLSLRMTQAMNHYQREECHCFICGVTDHFSRDCPHQETFPTWHKEHLNSKGVGPQQKVPTLKSPPWK